MEISILRSKRFGERRKIIWVHLKHDGVFGFRKNDIFIHALIEGCNTHWCVYTDTNEDCTKRHERLIQNKLFNDLAFNHLHSIKPNKPNLIAITGGKDERQG